MRRLDLSVDKMASSIFACTNGIRHYSADNLVPGIDYWYDNLRVVDASANFQRPSPRLARPRHRCGPQQQGFDERIGPFHEVTRPSPELALRSPQGVSHRSCTLFPRHVHGGIDRNRTSRLPLSTPPRPHTSRVAERQRQRQPPHAADSRDGRKYSRQQLQRAT
jgi:hypothetical protein